MTALQTIAAPCSAIPDICQAKCQTKANAVEKLSNPLYVSLYETYLQMQEAYTCCYPPQMENYLDLETRFENLARLKLTAGRTQYLEGGNTLDALIWETLESFKLDYGT